MAYAATQDPTQQQQQQPGAPGAIQAPVPTAGAPGAGPTGAKTPTGTASSQQAAQPFTNLQAYLSANAPQVQQQANTIATGLTNQYGQAQQDVNTGVQNFNQSVAAGYTPENPQLVQQAAANPAQFVQTPGNTQAFQSQINDQYTGPANFEGTAGYQSLNNEVTQDAANANLVNTPAGLQTYLQQSEVNPTQGENMLDAALLQGNPQAITQVEQAAQPFSQLPQYLASDVTSADALAAAAPTAAQQAATDAANALGTTAGNFNTALQGELSTDTANFNNYNQQVQAAQSAQGGLTQDAAALAAAYQAAGITPPTLNQTFPNTAIVPPTQASAATPSDYAEAQALAQLGGSLYTNPLPTTAPAPYTPQTYSFNEASELAPYLSGAWNNFVTNPNLYNNNFGAGNPPMANAQKAFEQLLAQLQPQDPTQIQSVGGGSFNGVTIPSYLGLNPTTVPGLQPLPGPPGFPTPKNQEYGFAPS